MVYKKGDPRYLAYRKAEYQRNRRAYIRRATELRKKRQEWMRELKAQPCSDCGKNYPHYVMDFDHRPETKEGDISQMFSHGASLERLMFEIAKCQIVCANCHRIRTHKRSLERKKPDAAA